MIDILMATYNGDKFLEQQLDSIIEQSCTEWRLIIRDDCSYDNTLPILNKYQQNYPDKIKIIPSTHPSGSAMNNFFKLLNFSKSDYVMFSDQDDVWKKDKIVITLTKMKEMEQKYGKTTPLLVHTDLCVVEENLSILNPSIFVMQNMDYKRNRLNNMLATNIVTGCTMMINKPLLNLLTKKPCTAVMHDMWIALVASAFGRIGFVNEATILYRQHENNANGVKDVHSLSYVKKEVEHLRDIKKSIELRYNQAEEFLKMYKGLLDEKQIILLQNYIQLKHKNLIEKAYILFKYDFKKTGAIRFLGQIMF